MPSTLPAEATDLLRLDCARAAAVSRPMPLRTHQVQDVGLREHMLDRRQQLRLAVKERSPGRPCHDAGAASHICIDAAERRQVLGAPFLPPERHASLMRFCSPGSEALP